MENITYRNHKALFDFNLELQKLADKIMDIELHKVTPKVAFAGFVLAKSHKSHSAILHLCKKGYGEDAAILVRSLFDLSVTFMYILKERTNKRLFRYFSYDWIIRKKIFDYATTIPVLRGALEERRKFPRPDDVALGDVQENAKLVQEKYRYGRVGWSDKTIKDMAEDVGKGAAYKTAYYLQSNIAHSAARVMNDYIIPQSSGLTIHAGPSLSWVEEDLVASFDFFESIIDRYCRLLKVGFQKELNDLSKRYVEEVGSINKRP